MKFNFRLLLLFSLCFNFFNCFSQISGNVKDGNSREILVGARVEVLGGQRTASDANGNFKLNVNEYPEIVHFIHVGYSFTLSLKFPLKLIKREQYLLNYLNKF